MKRIYVGFFVIVALILFFVFEDSFKGDGAYSDSADEKLSSVISRTEMKGEIPLDSAGSQAANVTPVNRPSSFSSPQEELNFLIDETSKEMERCKSDLDNKLPKGLMDGDVDTTRFKNPLEMYSYIDEYYEIMNRKLVVVTKLDDFIDQNIDKDIDYDKMNDKLKNSQLPDCGDFEEHGLLSLMVEAADDNEWTPNQKCDALKHVLRKFKEQVGLKNTTIGLAVKIGVINELIEEGFIPERYREDVQELVRSIGQSRVEIMNMIPRDMRDNSLSRKDFVALRDREKDEARKNAPKVSEFIDLLLSRDDC